MMYHIFYIMGLNQVFKTHYIEKKQIQVFKETSKELKYLIHKCIRAHVYVQLYTYTRTCISTLLT